MNYSNQTDVGRSQTVNQLDEGTRVSLSLSYGVVLLVAVVGNSLVINFARTNTRMKSNVFNLFLICMAAADIINVIFVVPLHWIFFYYGNVWIGGTLGTISCKLVYFLVELSIFASVLSLVAITMDRYFAICHIEHAPMSRSRTRSIVLCIWACSVLLSSLQLYKFKIINHVDGRAYCVSTWNQFDPAKRQIIAKYEMAIKFALSYGIPLSLMIALYALIIRELRRRLHSMVVEDNQELQKHIAHQNRPLVEMFITLVIIFAICWFPVHVNHMLIGFDYDAYRHLPAIVPLIFYLLAHANAALNPLLYFIFISGFRRELKKNAKQFWLWLTMLVGLSSQTASSHPIHTNRYYQSHNNNMTAVLNHAPSVPSTPPLFLKNLHVNTSGSTNRGLNIDNDLNICIADSNSSSHNSSPAHSLTINSEMSKAKTDKSAKRPLRQSHSFHSSYVNRGYHKNKHAKITKSFSLPWKLSTFV